MKVDGEILRLAAEHHQPPGEIACDISDVPDLALASELHELDELARCLAIVGPLQSDGIRLAEGAVCYLIAPCWRKGLKELLERRACQYLAQRVTGVRRFPGLGPRCQLAGGLQPRTNDAARVPEPQPLRVVELGEECRDLALVLEALQQVRARAFIDAVEVIGTKPGAGGFVEFLAAGVANLLLYARTANLDGPPVGQPIGEPVAVRQAKVIAHARGVCHMDSCRLHDKLLSLLVYAGAVSNSLGRRFAHVDAGTQSRRAFARGAREFLSSGLPLLEADLIGVEHAGFEKAVDLLL
jgi:hypothetical protein